MRITLNGGTKQSVQWLGPIHLLTFICRFNAAREFKELLFLGQSLEVCLLALLQCHFFLKTDAGQVLMPFTDKPFNPGAGGLLAALMMGVVVAYLERAIDKSNPIHVEDIP